MTFSSLNGIFVDLTSSFRFRLSLFIFHCFLFFSDFVAYIRHAHTPAQEEEDKEKTDPEDRNRKETNKTAFSNFTFEEEKKMHYEIENSLSFFLYVCFYVDGFFSILSYSVN